MKENVIKFYLEANKLKNTVRTGWSEVGIPEERVESVAEHVFGSMALVLALVSEGEYRNLDLIKVFKMLIVRELFKGATTEQSITSNEDKKATNRTATEKIVSNLSASSELMALYDEAFALETSEAKFAQNVTKLESDIQAKKYELTGDFTLENALKDIEYYPADIKEEIKPQVKNASDGWLLFDRRYYKDDETFEELSKYIQSLTTLD